MHNINYPPQRRSPSKLKSLELSPLFVDDPNQEVHPITAEGTLMHEALETGDDSKLTTDQAALVEKCRTYTSDLRKDYPYEKNELELSILGMRGFADKVMFDTHYNRKGWQPKKAVLVDYKFGFSAQEPVETNPAAQAYVLGIFESVPSVGQIEVVYLYPRRDEVSQHVYTRKDVAWIRLRLTTILARCDEAAKTGQCSPHTSTCEYCVRRGSCPQLHAMVLPIATRYAASGLNKAVAELGVEVQTFDPSLIHDPATMSKALAVASVLEKWTDSVKFHAQKLREEGAEIPGYEWVQRVGKRSLVNPKLVLETVEGRVSHEQLLQCMEIKLKPLLDAAAENAPRGKKGLVKQQLEDELRDKGLLEVGADSYYLKRSK